MRCLSCNNILTDFEATRKFSYSKKYVDLCLKCQETIPDMPDVLERSDLSGQEIYLEEE